MKCVKCLKSESIFRTKNATAFKLVQKGKHEFASKEEWKKDGRKYK